jgi:LysM repeat protein
MPTKRIVQLLMVAAILAVSFAAAADAAAGARCPRQITVQLNDTLDSIAATCGITVDALRAENPGIGWHVSYGQVLYIPGGYSESATSYPSQMGTRTYTVQAGDTLGGIAMLYGVYLTDLIAANPQIGNTSLIYPGQVVYLPGSAQYPSGSYPSYSYLPANYPTPFPTSGYSDFRVTFGHGLLIRTGPGKNNAEIVSPLVSVVKNTHWLYKRSSMTVDSMGLVWVEISLGRIVNGYSTGWVNVSDSQGNYFTYPYIGPYIKMRDP